MADQQLIELRLDNSPAALARLLLVFSRRRVRITELAMIDNDDAEPAVVRLGFRLDAGALPNLLLLLRRIVEVRAVGSVGPMEIAARDAA